MSSVSNVAIPQLPSSRLAQDSQVNMQDVAVTPKATRIEGQNQDNFVNLATSQAQNSKENQQYAHQHHIALNAYLGRDPKQQEQIKEGVQAIEHGIGTEGKKGSRMMEESKATDSQGKESVGKTDSKDGDKEKTSSSEKKGVNGKELTPEEEQKVKDMQERDKEVRVHEQAHKSAGGQYASAPSYSYETGPDGKRYITDGEVSIDIGEEDDPQATIEKMQVVKRAALAPQEPSAQDRRVYAEASQKEAAARQELAKNKQEEAEEAKEEQNSDKGSTISSKSAKEAEDKLQPKDLDKVEPPKIKGTDTKSFSD